MTAPFDWAGLAGSVVLANAGQGPDAAIAILQREIEAAFVPVEDAYLVAAKLVEAAATIAALKAQIERLERALRSIAWPMNEAGPWAQAVAASALDAEAIAKVDDGA